MKDQSHLIDDLDKANTQRLALNLEIVSIKSKVEVTQILWPRDHHRTLACSPGAYLGDFASPDRARPPLSPEAMKQNGLGRNLRNETKQTFFLGRGDGNTINTITNRKI